MAKKDKEEKKSGVCPRCEGSGIEPETDDSLCKECHGIGVKK